MIIKMYEGFLKSKKIPEINFKPLTKVVYDKINQCFLDISDIGFDVDILLMYISGHPEHVIYIHKNEKNFNIEEVVETLKFAIPYLSGEFGLKILKVIVTTASKGRREEEKIISFFEINKIYILNDVKIKSIKIIYEIN